MKDGDEDFKDKRSELRRRAELGAREKSLGIPDVSALSTEEVQQLIHELQVHQVELEMQNEKLRESEELYRLLFERGKDAVVVHDLESMRFLEANPASEALWGYTKSELMTMTPMDLSLEPDKTREALEQAAKPGGTQVSIRWQRKKDGSSVAVEISASLPFTWKNRNVLYSIVRDITERKKRVAALRESEALYRDLVENIEDLVCKHDLQGNLIFANSSSANLLGYGSADLVGTNLRSYLAPEVRDQFDAYLAAIQRDGCASGLMLVQTRTGEKRIWEFRNTLRRESAADPMVLGIARDVTDRKRAEDELRESEQRYRAVVDSIEVGISLLNSNMEIVEVNKAMKRYFPHVQPACGQICYEHYNDPPRSEPCSYCPCVLTLQDGEVHEAITETPAGSEIRYYHLVSSPIKDSEGRVQYVIELTEDITDRKRVEEALRLSEERYRRLFEDAPLMYAITRNERGIPLISDCNELFLSSVGYTREEVVGQPLADFYSPESRADLLEHGGYARALAGEFFIGERQLLTRDSRLIPTLLYTAVEVDPSGHVNGTRAMFVDITERKKTENALRKSEERLELALSGADLGLWDLEIQTGKAVSNQRSAEMVGYSLDEIEQNFGFWERLLHPDDRQRALEKVFNHLSSFTDSYEDEYRVLHKSGAWKWIFSRGKVTERDSDGKPLRMTGTYLDITDKKSSDMRVAEANELREKILAASPVGIEVFKANGQCVLVNDAMGRAIGGTKEQLFTQNFRHMATWEAVGLLDDADQVLSTGVDKQREMHVVSTLGKEVWAETRLTRFNSGGEPHLLLVVNDVSESRKAEAALRFEREQLLSIFGSINEVILVIDPRTYEILYANKFTENLFGTDIIGGNCYEKLNGFDSPCEHCANDRLMELQGQPYQWEYHNPVLKRDFLATDRMIRWPDGRDVKFQLAIDITEAKQADQALRESEEKYRAVFDNAGIGITVVDRDSRKLTQANPALVKMLGYTEEELRQLTHLDITHPEDREITKQHVDSVMEGALNSFDLEKRYIKKDGGIIWGHLSVSTIQDAERNPRAAVGMIAEITGRKKAEEAIRKSEEMLELALQAADIGLWDWNLKTGWAVWNERATRMLGHLPGEVQPNLRAWKSLVHPEDWPHVSEVLNSHLAGRLPLLEVEYRLRCKSGEWKWILGRGKVVEYDEHGKPSRMIGTNLDVTERKCAELEKADLREQLIQSQKMESIGTLAGGIAHDFNNLLTVILGFSELIITEKKKGDQEYEDLAKVIHAARTAGDMVQQILAFSRKTETKLRPINLNKEVGQLKKMLSRLIPKTIVVEISLDSGLPTVNADPAQIEQILMNLAVNSRDSMPNGGRLLIKTQTVMLDEKYCRLHLEAAQGRHALLVVTDTGVGIDRTTMDRIFEPFYTTKKPGQGTGLGLAMVYGIVKSHGGHITCESELGRGTTFKIYLPAHQAEGEADVTVSGEFSALGAGIILLVDDEEFVRQLGQRILERAGYTVITATNGQEAVEVYKEKGNRISLVILDLIMPMMDGNKCLEEILKLDPEARVLIASGYSPDGTMRETLEGGAKGFVGKPYNLKQLLKTVWDALNER